VFRLAALALLGLASACSPPRPTAAVEPPPAEAAAEAGAQMPPAPTAEARVHHHLREVSALAGHFERLLREPCPRFATPAEWTAYLEGEVDRVILLNAHLKEAASVARRTGDEALVQVARAPRRRADEALALVVKFQGCARENGAELDPFALARRVDRQVRQRRAEIRLAP
jgi:hypothetical protein